MHGLLIYYYNTYLLSLNFEQKFNEMRTEFPE